MTPTAPLAAPVVVIGGDDAFALPLAVTMSSLLGVLPAGSTLYVFDGGLSDVHAKRLRVLAAKRETGVHVEWVRPDDRCIEGLPTTKHLRKATYLRLLIPHELPETVTRVLYLDTDIVLRRDIMELWRTDFEGRPLAACQDAIFQHVDKIPTHREQGLRPDAAYFNAGVLLIDLARWRAEGISERVLANVVANGDGYPLLDQDGLNAVLSDNWKRLPERWNVQVGSKVLGYHLPSAAEADVVHFTGKGKPWSGWWMVRNRGGILSEYGRVFFEELKRSEWLSNTGYVWFRMGVGVKGVGCVLRQTVPVRALRFAGRQIEFAWQYIGARSAVRHGTS